MSKANRQHYVHNTSTEMTDQVYLQESICDDVSQSSNNQIGSVTLYGVEIVSLVMENKERLCLAQISSSLLKDYSYNEIHNRRVALGITCAQCTPVQLELLRRAGAMPVTSRRCGMITRREAERLCKSFLGDQSPPKLPENFAFDVKHECAWGCRGAFLPSRYNSSRAKCIKCFLCHLFFSPNKFIFHSHRLPDSKYTQPDAANFNSWRRHVHLTGSPPDQVIFAWEDVKAMFNGGSRKRMTSSTVTSSAVTSSSSSSSPSANHPMYDDHAVSGDGKRSYRDEQDAEDDVSETSSTTLECTRRPSKIRKQKNRDVTISVAADVPPLPTSSLVQSAKSSSTPAINFALYETAKSATELPASTPTATAAAVAAAAAPLVDYWNSSRFWTTPYLNLTPMSTMAAMPPIPPHYLYQHYNYLFKSDFATISNASNYRNRLASHYNSTFGISQIPRPGMATGLHQVAQQSLLDMANQRADHQHAGQQHSDDEDSEPLVDVESTVE